MLKAPEVNLRPRHKEVLEQIVKSRTARSDHRQRAQLILLFDQDISNRKAGKEVGLKPHQTGIWRRRWLEYQNQLIAIEDKYDSRQNNLLKGIEEVLSDLPRSGTTPKFTAEQIAQILTVACEDPTESDLPTSHWTLNSLRSEVIKRGIVDTISTSRLQVFLKSGRIKTA